MLEHIRELHKAMSELHRVLRRGGWLLVEVPCCLHPCKTKDCRNLTRKEDLIACGGQYDHVWSFSCDDFHQSLEMHGFECKDGEDGGPNIKEKDNLMNAAHVFRKASQRLYPQYVCMKK